MDILLVTILTILFQKIFVQRKICVYRRLFRSAPEALMFEKRPNEKEKKRTLNG
jgi:hypothetical protein